MKAIVIGAGDVGFNLARNLAKERIDVVVIDEREEAIRKVTEEMDVQTLRASGTNFTVLSAVGVKDADMLLAVTEMDEKNIVACLIAKECGVGTTVARIREHEFTTKDFSISLNKLGVDHVINPNRLVAQEIAQLVKIPSVSDWYEFAEGKVKLMGFNVGKGAPMADKKLKELPAIPSFRVAAILRNDSAIIPSGEDRILSGDKLFVITMEESLKKVLPLITKEKLDDSRKVVIVGGGRVGYNVAMLLDEENFSLTIIEKDLKRCNFLSERLKRTLVLNGDGTDERLLMHEGISNTHTLITVTDDDQVNLLAALLAERHKVQRTISLITREEFIPLASSLGIKVPINPNKLTADSILKLVRKPRVLSLAILPGDRAEIIELAVLPTFRCVGVPLRELKVPRGSLIGAVVRGEKIMIPGGEDSILSGDRVIIFTLTDNLKKVEALFKG